MDFFDPEIIDRINSMTKYPSIETYHELGEKGLLKDDKFLPFPPGTKIITEKVDGTNSRLIFFPENLSYDWTSCAAHQYSLSLLDSNYVIGSREELLYAQGDKIINPTLSVVETCLPLAERSLKNMSKLDNINLFVVLFVETFGGTISVGSKNYTGEKRTSTRLFDVCLIDNWEELLSMDKAKIASWRESGGQKFIPETELLHWSSIIDCPLTPRLGQVEALPRGLRETLQFLQEQTPATNCSLDAQARGKTEGVVVRTPDRSYIAKMRFEDYERTLRKVDDAEREQRKRMLKGVTE